MAVTILALFSPGDVVLTAGRVVYNLKLPSYGRTLALLALVSVWVPSRLYHFARQIYLYNELCPYVRQPNTAGWFHFYFGLWPLFAMQAFWFVQMIQAAARAMRRGVVTDHVHDPKETVSAEDPRKARAAQVRQRVR